MNERKLSANRKNALKSTGPRTAAGKGRSSRNSYKHGLLQLSPIIPELESAKCWEDHLRGVFESTKPVGYLERQVAYLLAEAFWRRYRMIRYEARHAAVALAMTESDLYEQSGDFSGKPENPEYTRRAGESASRVLQICETLPLKPDEEKIDKRFVEAVLQMKLFGKYCQTPRHNYAFREFRMKHHSLISTIGRLAYFESFSRFMLSKRK